MWELSHPAVFVWTLFECAFAVTSAVGIITSHQNRGVWGRSLSVSLVQVTDLKVPVLAVTHVHITDTYCFQYKLLKKCQETSCLCTLLQRRSMSVLQSQAQKESDSVSAASPFMLLFMYHKWLFFLQCSTWSTLKVEHTWGRNGLCSTSGTMSTAWSVPGVRKCAGIW